MIRGSTFSAFIFDCDGVLVNSELIVQKIVLAHLAQHGLQYDLETFSNKFTGIADNEFYTLLNQDAEQETGTPLPEAFRTTLEELLGSAIRADLQAVSGAFEFVSSLNHVRAVASSSGAQHLIDKLSMTGLIDLFGGNVFSADAVENGKPAPDVFLHAADRLGVAPDQCLVMEDSINGVLAARSAGMRVIGFTGGGHCLPGPA
ncbi:MAG: HAD superfamily hydrolase (TIGR01509 family), partial [Candidatus Azotimanducaceae bacterium]